MSSMNNKLETKVDNYEMVTGTNPILKMDYPDPDVIRVGNAFYMITTTMHFMPGAEILKSYDLINWEHETYVYDKLDSKPVPQRVRCQLMFTQKLAVNPQFRVIAFKQCRS